VRPEGLGKFKNHLIGNRTRDLPVCSIDCNVSRRLKRRLIACLRLDDFGLIKTKVITRTMKML
jgi:hypothetical protein